MPKADKSSSTQRRQRLAEFIDSEGTTMVKPCQTCTRHGRVCKVHIRSGKCGECLRRGQRCDVKVAESEWKYLKEERLRLRRKLLDAQDAQRRARESEDRARRAVNAAFEKEMRIRQQMDLLEDKAAEAIAVEEASIEEQEAEEALAALEPSEAPGFALHPNTWNTMEGGFNLDLDFWSIPPDPGLDVGSPSVVDGIGLLKSG